MVAIANIQHIQGRMPKCCVVYNPSNTHKEGVSSFSFVNDPHYDCCGPDKYRELVMACCECRVQLHPIAVSYCSCH